MQLTLTDIGDIEGWNRQTQKHRTKVHGLFIVGRPFHERLNFGKPQCIKVWPRHFEIRFIFGNLSNEKLADWVLKL